LSEKTKEKNKTRLNPTPSTLRKIHVLSGNQCTKPGCNTVLVNLNQRGQSHLIPSGSDPFDSFERYEILFNETDRNIITYDAWIRVTKL
jgi:hypothetical protein